MSKYVFHFKSGTKPVLSHGPLEGHAWVLGNYYIYIVHVMTSGSKSQHLCHTVRNSVSCSLNFYTKSQKILHEFFYNKIFLSTITHKLILAQTRTWRWNDPITLTTTQTTQYSLSNYSSIWKFVMLVKIEGHSPEQHTSLVTTLSPQVGKVITRLWSNILPDKTISAFKSRCQKKYELSPSMGAVNCLVLMSHQTKFW